MTVVELHEVLAPFIFICIYSAAISLSLPVGATLSVIAGFLFSQPYCTIYVVFGATLGASFLFFLAKTTYMRHMKQMLGEKERSAFKQQVIRHFEEDATSYLLFLRLVPIFPFWLVNLVPAFFKISFFTFFWTTLIGIIPASFVYTQAGVGLGAILDAGNTLNPQAVFNGQVKIALAALGIFALLPVIIKKFTNYP